MALMYLTSFFCTTLLPALHGKYKVINNSLQQLKINKKQFQEDVHGSHYFVI